MLAKVLTGAVVGLDSALVDIEVDIAPGGKPHFLVVGLPMPLCRRPASVCAPRSTIATCRTRRGGATCVAWSLLDLGMIRALATALGNLG